MKHFVISVLITLISSTLIAQDSMECEKIANIVIEAVSKQDINSIKPYLAEEIEIAGQSTPIAEKILEQLVNSLGSIKNFELTQADTSQGLILNYNIDYERYGIKQAFFEFNTAHKITKLELLAIEVKTAKTDASKIEYNSSNMIEIPFTIMENLIVVKAHLNGEEQDFILDSGSGFTLINSKYLEKNTANTEKGKHVLSNAKGVHNESLSGTDIVKASVHFHGIRANKQDMLSLDISHLERNGTSIYGLIGFDFLSKYDVLYDYNKNVVTLINPDYFQEYKKEKLAKYLIESLPIQWQNHIPIIEIKIDNDYYKMGIDCGAGVNLLDTSLLPKMKRNLKKITTKSLSGASKGKKQVTHAKLKKHYAGTTSYKNTQFVFNDIAHLNKDKEVKIDGLLGYEFLSKQLTLLSHQRKELLIIK